MLSSVQQEDIVEKEYQENEEPQYVDSKVVPIRCG